MLVFQCWQAVVLVDSSGCQIAVQLYLLTLKLLDPNLFLAPCLGPGP